MKTSIQSAYGNSMKIMFGILLALVLLFLYLNRESLSTSITLTLIGSVDYPFWVWLILSLLCGGLAWFLLTFKSRRMLKKTISEQKKELSKLKDELDKLRNLSLTDDVKSIESVSPANTIPKQDQ